MSKAFTKDDGPPPAEVPRRRPPLPSPNYVTSRGLQALRAELAALPPAPREDLNAVERRADLEARIATAVLVPAPVDRGEIRFGAHVEVRNDEGASRRIQIVGVDEADPAGGSIAFVAPLARALLGHRVGDEVQVRTPAGEEALEILAVAYDDT